MPTFFVVNPAAGRGRGKTTWEQIRPKLRDSGPWDAALTTGPGDATALARSAAQGGFDRVVALGGDGTVNEVVNGLFGTSAALAVIPGGTGNDYYRYMGIPRDPDRAAEFAMTGPVMAVDVGEVETAAGRRLYPNVAGFGFDAEVARAVNAFPKYMGGTIPYLLGVVKTLWRYRPVPMQLLLDGQPVDRKVFLVAAGISRAYGGGMMITPGALLDDGLLDICIAGDVRPLEVLALIPKIYGGRHTSHPKVEMRRCRELRVLADIPVGIQADGEYIGELPAIFRVHPSAIKVIAAVLPK